MDIVISDGINSFYQHLLIAYQVSLNVKEVNWVLGGIACTYDKILSYCICSQGYSELDDFNYYNDCHISHQIRGWC